MEEAQECNRVPRSMREALDRECTEGGKVGREARRVKQVIQNIGKRGGKMDMQTYKWCMQYMKIDNRADNERQVNIKEYTAEEGSEANEWRSKVSDELRTMYAGEREVEGGAESKGKASSSTGGKKKRRLTVGLQCHSEWEKGIPDCNVPSIKGMLKEGKAKEVRGEEWAGETLQVEGSSGSNGDSVWRAEYTDSSGKGYEAWQSVKAMGSPVARLMARSATIEMGLETDRRVTDVTGEQRIWADEGNIKDMKEGGAQEMRKCVKVMLALHKVHKFTHCVATDGSKAGGRVGYGAWWGPHTPTDLV